MRLDLIGLSKRYGSGWVHIKDPRCFFFFFLAVIVAWGMILTCDSLLKRGYKILGWCCTCRCSGVSL